MDVITIAGIVGIIGILLGFYLPIILENIKHKNLHIKIGNFFEYDSITKKGQEINPNLFLYINTSNKQHFQQYNLYENRI